jgi:hypothetical protein
MLKEMLTGKTGFMFSASHGSPTNFAGPTGYVQARKLWDPLMYKSWTYLKNTVFLLKNSVTLHNSMQM